MANKKISELSTRTPSLSDLMLVGDPSSGYSYKCTITSLATIIETDIADGYVTLSTAQTISGAKTFSNNLTLTSVSNAGVDTDKFLVLNGSNIVNFRTGSEVLSDIGGQGALTLTTTGTSGAATLVGNTLNIPQYQGAITLTTTGTSGAATLVGNTLNIPNYAPDLSGYVPTSRTITINGTTQDLTANRTYNVGTVTSVAASAGTGISISGSPITTSGTITITNTAPDQIVALTAGTGISVSGTYPNFTITNSSPSSGGTVTSVALSAPTGFAVTGSPITSSGTLALAFSSGYSLPTTASQSNWNSAYDNMIVSAAVTGTTTKTLTLTQQDAGTITASWSDLNTDAVTSVFGRTGAVVAANGDYTTAQVTESGNLYYTDARARASLSAGTGISYSSATGVISSTITQYTDALARAAISLTTTGSSGAATYSSSTGVLNIPNYTLSALGGISGSGTANRIAMFTGTTAIGDSSLYYDSTYLNIGIKTAPPVFQTNTALGLGSIVISGASTNWQITKRVSDFNGWKYLSTGENVAMYQLDGNNNYLWYVAPAGTAGGAVSWTEIMKLDSSGNLTIGNIAAATTDTDKFLVSDGGVVKYRTGSEVLSDIGAAASTSISGTTNYIPKFTSSSAIGNSLLREGTNSIGLGYTPSTWSYTGFQINGAALHGSPTETDAGLSANAYYNSGWKYYANNYASQYRQVNGEHEFNIAGIGTAGNSVSFSTAIKILTSGNVGIGTTNPAQKLHISESNTTAYSSSSASLIQPDGGVNLLIQNTGTAGFSSLRFASLDGSYAIGYIGFNNTSSGVTGSFVFGQRNGTSSYTEQMRLDASGNLGLGVTPSAWTSGNAIQIGSLRGLSLFGGTGIAQIANNVYYSSTLGGYFYGGTGVASLYTLDGGNHVWSIAPSGTVNTQISFTQAMTLDADGDLGIGITNPTSLLHVNSGTTATQTVANFAAANYGSSSSRTYIQIGTQYGDGSSRIGSINTTGNQSALVFQTQSATSGVWNDAMYINGSGNVGIGTNSPGSKLEINGDGNFKVASGNVGYSLTSNTTAYSFYLNSGDNSYRIYSSIGAIDRVVLTSGGNVGIGTNSPNYKLEVNGNTSVSGTLNITSGNNLQWDGGSAGITNSTNDMVFKTYSGSTLNEKMRITSGGNVGINTQTPNINGGAGFGTVLTLLASSNYGGLEIYGNGSTNGGQLDFGSGTVRYASLLGEYESSTNGRMIFRTNRSGTMTEAMRITSDGEVWIANTTDQGAYNLQVGGTGVWGAGAYVNGSDIALKENIFDLDVCLDLVKQLKPVTYKYKQSYSRDTSTQTGFIAQDLKELFKDKSYLGGLVKEGGQHLSVAYQNLIPLLVKAIQEQQAEIEILKNK